MSLFQVEGLVKRFGGLLATDHVSLSVEPGEIHALIGPNGAGKTTLVNQISGLLAPDAGRIMLDGQDLTHLPMHRRVALGHAGFMGVGAYAVVVLSDAGWGSAWGMWAAAVGFAALTALLIGAVSLRTKGVYFIMITLAFAQMLYYVFVSLRSYGGDDGYSLMARPALGMGLDMADEATLYWVVLAIVAALLWWLDRAAGSRFGTALVGIRDNEIRMRALGYPVYLLQLTAFVVAGAIAGLAGALLATGNSFVSPSMMHWTQSATLIVMVIIGGLGRRWGGPVGAAVWLALEEALKLHTSHWHMPLGLLLIATALYAPKGLAALSDLWARSKP